jgi:hypothetical protein
MAQEDPSPSPFARDELLAAVTVWVVTGRRPS